MQIAFRDGGNLTECKDPLWLKSPSRRLLRYVYALFAQINNASADENPSDVYCKKDLYLAMEFLLSHRNGYDQNSSTGGIIVWATIPSRQYFQVGLCFVVKFSNAGVHALPRAVAEHRHRVNVSAASLQYPHFQSFGSWDPHDLVFIEYEDIFFKLMTTMQGTEQQTLSVIVFGRLHVLYIVNRMLEISDSFDPLDEVTGERHKLCYGVRIRDEILDHRIGNQYSVMHLWASKIQARQAWKNHPYKWKNLFDRTTSPTELNMYHPNLLSQHAKKGFDRHDSLIKLFFGKLSLSLFARSWQQLVLLGFIDVDHTAALRKHVESFSASPDYQNIKEKVEEGSNCSNALRDMYKVDKFPFNQNALEVIMVVKLIYTSIFVPYFNAVQANPRDAHETRELLREIENTLRKLFPSRSMHVSQVIEMFKKKKRN